MKGHALPAPAPQPVDLPPGTRALYDAFGTDRPDIAIAHLRGTPAHLTAQLLVTIADQLNQCHDELTNATENVHHALQHVERTKDRPNPLGVLQGTAPRLEIAAGRHDLARQLLTVAIHTHQKLLALENRPTTTAKAHHHAGAQEAHQTANAELADLAQTAADVAADLARLGKRIDTAAAQWATKPEPRASLYETTERTHYVTSAVAKAQAAATELAALLASPPPPARKATPTPQPARATAPANPSIQARRPR